MKRLFRYPLALVCLILAAYCFLREAGPAWTRSLAPDPYGIENQVFLVLGFTPDSQSFWCSGQIEGNETLCQKRDCATGKLLAEQRFKNFTFTSNQTTLSPDGRFLINQTTPQHISSSRPFPTWLLDLETGATHKFDNQVCLLHALSPSSKWLIATGHKLLSITLREGRAVELELHDEPDETARNWTPYTASFSPDEKLLAVLWTQFAEKGREARSEVRFYSTTTWKEASRLRLPDTQVFALHRWIDQGLCLTAYAYPPASKGAYYQFAYCINHVHPLSDKTPVLQPLVECVSYAALPSSPVNSLSNIIQRIGNDWHAQLHIDHHERPGWLISLSQLPIISRFLKIDGVSDNRTLQFYQTSTQRLLSSIPCSETQATYISPDGQWLLASNSNPAQLTSYSTAPLLRWPGYILGLAGVVAFFWRKPRAVLRQRPEPVSA